MQLKDDETGYVGSHKTAYFAKITSINSQESMDDGTYPKENALNPEKSELEDNHPIERQKDSLTIYVWNIKLINTR